MAGMSTEFLNSFKAAAYTALFTFLATAGTALLGVLDAVSSWAAGGDVPDFSTAREMVLSAFIAGVSSLVNFVVRYIQTKNNPAAGPQYQS